MKLLLALLFCAYLQAPINGAKILGIFHVPARSHHSIGANLLKGLAAKGHQVTMLSCFPFKDPVPNYKDLFIEGVTDKMEEIRKTMFQTSLGNKLIAFQNFSNLTFDLTDAVLRSAAMQKLLKSDEKFDAVIVEGFGNEALYGLAQHFNASLIVTSTSTSSLINHLSGNVAPFSFVPNGLLSLSDRMSFLQRVANTLVGLFLNGFMSSTVSGQKILYDQYFKGGLNFEDNIKSVDIFLINSHVVFETPRPYMPNMIQVGGMHISKPKNLPKDLQKFMDDAKEGVIFFSLGSNLQSSYMADKTRNAILNTFAKLPQKIIWKFEEDLPGKPDNLKIGKWFPQSDILAHPNTKLFISHGGLLSTMEAVYRGVPVLGIPFYGDQSANTANLVTSGCGVPLEYKELTEETFTKAIQEVINNPKYSNTMKEKSKIVQDQDMHPLDRAIFWIEYAIRHKGSSHLKSASLELSLAQYLLLDVVAFIVAVLGTFTIGMYCIIRKLCSCGRKTGEVHKKTKSKLA